MGIYYLTPIKIASLKSRYDDLRRRDIGRHGNIVKVAHTQKLSLYGVVLGRNALRACIAEIEKHVDLVVRNSGSYLFFSSLLSRHKSVDVKSRCLGYIFCRNCSCAQIMLTENSAISYAKLSHQLFFHVVCDDRNFHRKIPPFFWFLSYVSQMSERTCVGIYILNKYARYVKNIRIHNYYNI